MSKKTWTWESVKSFCEKHSYFDKDAELYEDEMKVIVSDFEPTDSLIDEVVSTILIHTIGGRDFDYEVVYNNFVKEVVKEEKLQIPRGAYKTTLKILNEQLEEYAKSLGVKPYWIRLVNLPDTMPGYPKNSIQLGISAGSWDSKSLEETEKYIKVARYAQNLADGYKYNGYEYCGW